MSFAYIGSGGLFTKAGIAYGSSLDILVSQGSSQTAPDISRQASAFHCQHAHRSVRRRHGPAEERRHRPLHAVDQLPVPEPVP